MWLIDDNLSRWAYILRKFPICLIGITRCTHFISENSYYSMSAKLLEDNVFSCVRLSVILFTKGVPAPALTPPCTGSQANPYSCPLYGALAPFQVLWNLDCQEAGGWHSTEMSPYCNCFCFEVLEPMEIFYNLVVKKWPWFGNFCSKSKTMIQTKLDILRWV